MWLSLKLPSLPSSFRAAAVSSSPAASALVPLLEERVRDEMKWLPAPAAAAAALPRGRKELFLVFTMAPGRGTRGGPAAAAAVAAAAAGAEGGGRADRRGLGQGGEGKGRGKKEKSSGDAAPPGRDTRQNRADSSRRCRRLLGSAPH